jgi:hypothetical protein
MQPFTATLKKALQRWLVSNKRKQYKLKPTDMKTLKMLTFISCAMVIIACNSSKNPELSGVYTNQAQSEYSVASDTLIITAVSLANKTYSVERRTGYQKIRNGQKLPEQHKQEKWQATWNADQQVLSEAAYGRQISLLRDKPGVQLKNAVYLKIN